VEDYGRYEIGKGWYRSFFASEYDLFPYIGSVKTIEEMKKRAPVWETIVATVAKRITVTSILNLLSESIIQASLVRGSGDNKMVSELTALLADARKRLPLVKFIEKLQAQAARDERSFEWISSPQSGSRDALYQRPPDAVRGQIVVVEAQVVHKDALQQYDKNFAQTATAYPEEWMLTDFPPWAMAENEAFHGRVLLLSSDQGDRPRFGDRLPFRTSIGWYPYCRVTGFLRNDKEQQETSIDVITVEYRKPTSFLTNSKHARGQMSTATDTPTDRYLAGYLLPILAAGSDISNPSFDSAGLSEIRSYLDQTPELPSALIRWYEEVLAAHDH
jgi:hypothetical protein